MLGKKIVIKCPYCNTLVEGKIGIFHKKLACPNPACGMQIEPAKDAKKVVQCEECGCQVMYDTRKGGYQKCLNCGASLNSHKKTMVDVECPCCHVVETVPFDEEIHTCPVCNTTFNSASVKEAQETVKNSKATVVTVPAGNKYVIWELPQTTFPFATQLVVPEGYYALIERNGKCIGQSAPGNYLLSDMLKNQEDILHQAVLDPDTQVSVKILFVKKNLDKEIFWTGNPVDVKNEDAKIVGSLGFGGKISLMVEDAKTFAEFVGYESKMLSDLFREEKNASNSLENEVKEACFKAGLFVLMNRAVQFNFNYNVLEGDHLLFEDNVQEKADDLLQELGLKSNRFHLDFIHFEESDEIKKEKEKKEKEKNLSEAREKAIKNVCRFVEKQVEWNCAEPIHIHMKDDPTLSADITLGGKIQFKIIDKDKFLSCREVEDWADNNCDEAQVCSHLSALVNTGVGTPLTDTLQTVIDETGADVRELTRYYKYIRTQILENLTAYFAEEYGLKIQSAMFTMTEKSRSQSLALEMKSGFASHKTEAEIQDEMTAFDRKRRVTEKENASWEKIRNKEIDSNEAIQAATIDLKTKTELSGFRERDAENTKRDLNTNAGVEIYQTQLKGEIEKNQTHVNLDVDMDKDNAQAARLRNQTKNTYDQKGLVSSLEHGIEVQDLDQESEITDKNNERDAKDLENKKRKDNITHEINQQKIEQEAEELRTKWEAENKLKMAQLDAVIEAQMKKWEAEKKQSIDKNDVDHHIAQADADNSRIVDSIMKKIAESDLDMKEKEAALSLLLDNQQDASNLKSFQEWSEAKTNAHYRSEHMDNILNQEQKNFVDDRIARETARKESVRNADFARDMERKAKENEYDMDRIKMQYERDRYRDEMEQKLAEKEKEIEILNLQLQTAIAFGEQDTKKVKINAWADVQKTEVQGQVTDSREERQMDYADRRDQRQNELDKIRVQYQMEHEEKEREAADKRQQQEREREADYLEQAQKLFSEMMAIQASIQKIGLYNDREETWAGRDVKIAEAQYGAIASSDSVQKTLETLSKQIKEINEKIKKINKHIQGGHKPGQPGTLVGPAGGGRIPAQPGSKNCPFCGASMPEWNTYCPICYKPV